MMNISIVSNDATIPQNFLDKLNSLGKVTVFNFGRLTEFQFIEKITGTEILICGLGEIDKIGKTVFDGLKNLKFIATYGVGYDWIDIEEASKRNILVSTTVGSNSEAVAEHIWGMILNLSKRISELERVTREIGENNVRNYSGLEIFGKTIGIIGLGDIGKRVARISKGFDMRIIGTNKSGKLVENVELVKLEYLLKNSDIITLCLPLNSETKDIIGEAELQIMKNNVILINASRENIVNKKSVLKSLSRKDIFGYGVETDIFDTISPNDEYFQYPNVLLTPHNAWNTKESRERIYSTILKNVEGFLRNQPVNVVNQL